MPDTPRKPRAFDAAHVAAEADKSFIGKLAFFSGLEDNKRYGDLNHYLVLFHDEAKADSVDERDVVMGYVVNNPSSMRLRDLFNNPANNSLRMALSFPHILDSTVGKLSPEDDNLIDLVTFLTTAKPDEDFISKTGIRAHHFAGFSAYSCDHISQLHEVSAHINKHDQVLMLYNQFTIERIVLERMVDKGHAYIRDANPDILFYPKPSLRAAIAFPDDVPRFML